METKATAAGAAPDLITSVPVAPVQKVTPVDPPPPPSDDTDLRLIIERNEGDGSYVYVTINRRTGEVIQRLPRAALLHLGSQGGDVRGAVIRTTA